MIPQGSRGFGSGAPRSAATPVPGRRGLPWFALFLLAEWGLALAGGRGSAGEFAAALTAPERSWLEQHPGIRVGFKEEPPLVQPGKGTNRVEGLGVDYVRLLERQLGTPFTLVSFASWSRLLDAAKAREVDLLFTVPYAPERGGIPRFFAAVLRASLGAGRPARPVHERPGLGGEE